jgi:phosphate/sulfate permease
MYSHLLIPILIAFIFAVNMGGSGTGPSFSVAYGANVIPIRYIPMLFGVMVFLGVIIAGKATTATMGKELLPPQMMSTALVSIILIAVTISLLVANLAGIPQSTSQSTVLAITAPAIYYGVFKSDKLLYEIVPAWFILPILSFALCYFLARFLYKPLRKRGLTLSKELNQHPVLKYAILGMSL